MSPAGTRPGDGYLTAAKGLLLIETTRRRTSPGRRLVGFGNNMRHWPMMNSYSPRQQRKGTRPQDELAATANVQRTPAVEGARAMDVPGGRGRGGQESGGGAAPGICTAAERRRGCFGGEAGWARATGMHLVLAFHTLCLLSCGTKCVCGCVYLCFMLHA